MLYPKVSPALLPRMLVCAAAGALIAGIYGIIHDQFTYSISDEYFTKLKFHQFSYANFGWRRRLFVGEVGFLATWWVGLIAGWFIGRIMVPGAGAAPIARRCAIAFAIMFAIAVIGTFSGYVLGLIHGPDYSSWHWAEQQYGLTNLPAFVRVAYVHNSSYAGGFVGLVAALGYVSKVRLNV